MTRPRRWGGSTRRGFAAAAALLLAAACEPAAPPPPAPELTLPPRPADAPGGAEVAASVRGLDLAEREARIVAEVARGNVPGWLRHLEPVVLTGEVGARARSVTFWVTPDYLAVGSAEDFLRVPLSPRTARRVAELSGTELPTVRMVDAIWEAADVRLEPIRPDPSRTMRTVPAFESHDALVRGQRFLYGQPEDAFAAGHKIDVLVEVGPGGPTEQAYLYGWHFGDGRVGQPLIPIPMDNAPAFSHGVRLVHRRVLVDGEERDLVDALLDPELAGLLGPDAASPERW